MAVSRMHLYSMWSAALQRNAERFAVDYDGGNDDGETPSCLTNSAVESHFKSVKHGRSRVRPRAFVMSQLTYVLGKLNERKLPKERIKKTEPAAAEEKWRRRKRPARYADAAVASKWLKTLHRRLGAQHTAEDTTTSGQLLPCLCVDAMQYPVFATCCRSLIACGGCYQEWKQGHDTCRKCRHVLTDETIVTAVGLHDAISTLCTLIPKF